MRSRSSALVTAVALLLTVVVWSAPALAGPKPYKTTQGKSEPRYDEAVTEEYRVETKWGEIYGVVKRPVVPDGVKVPVILTYTPYSVLTNPLAPVAEIPGDPTANYFVPRGYARAIFDLVGTGASGGCYDYGGIRERKTGEAVVNFLGTREWSNGKVGMIGGSYDGTTQWAAAVETPKHLTTIVPQVAIDRWWDYAYSQGVRFYSGYGTPWLFDWGFGLVPTHITPHSPQALADHINPCERAEHNTRSFLPDPVYDEWWEVRDYLRRIENVEASVMIEGSWVDYNVHPRNSIYMWNALPDNHPKKLVMVMQGHGAANFPDSINIRHAWFDYWLLGLDTGVMDLPSVDSMGRTRQRFQNEQWPPAGTGNTSYELTADKAGASSLALVDADEPVWTDNDPNLNQNTSLNDGGGGADLLFVGAPVKSDVRIAGLPELVVNVKTDIENTWVTPVLFDEGPDGTRQWITSGMLNARNRYGLYKSIPIEPDEPWIGTVEFQPIDHILMEGHKLGVAVMSMNKSEALYWSGLVATNELLLGGRSRLIVPLASATEGLTN